ncbi:Cof-type HAD-IIB family hydrolase [Fusobacterium mortiferum]|uniref:Cof-type HAD-IIB family hydrolase n=1 Tax=Fusobacterium mortiferum TaxID=850 RepID=A0ABS2FZY5_FUSMR|nr:Cof-type HAD-IIB family hydrolase [Fusobacterium mortiferum]MBM6874157.1 Cof-type HAD-IIB family hydrolase [Fusobacterium mortiferum]
MIKAVFFDVDGTLVSFKTHRVPQSTLEAIKKLQAKGIKVFVATGRHPSILTEGNNVHEIDFDGFVTLNGQYCFTKNRKVIYENNICREDIVALLEFLKKNRFPCAFVEDRDTYMNYIDDVVVNLLKSVNVPLPPIEDIERAKDGKVFQLNPYIPVEFEAEVMKVLPNCEATRWSPTFIDVIPAGGGKHVAIQKIMEYYGYKKDEIMAFGDGGNDKTMLMTAGIGIAMGNANEDVKEIADYVTTSVDNDGVLNALKHFNVIE